MSYSKGCEKHDEQKPILPLGPVGTGPAISGLTIRSKL
jgi:hypothetical protein